MPTRRALVILGAFGGLFAVAVLRPAFIAPSLGLDAALVLAVLVDLRRAGLNPIRAERFLPQVLVQGSRARVDVRFDAETGTTVEARESLHEGVADAPVRGHITIARLRQATWSYTIVPRLRGDHTLGPLSVRVLGPWGLAWAQRDLIGPERRRVYPQVRWEGKVERLLRLADRRQLGRSPIRAHGFGSEPYGLREYRPGDPPARIHWKATARHSRLVTREDTWERGTSLVVLLDCARAMTSADASRSKLDYALAAALALTRLALGRGDRVTIVAFSDRIDRVVRVRAGRHGMSVAYRALYDLEARLCEPAYDLAAEKALEVAKRHARFFFLTSIVDLGAAELFRRALFQLKGAYRTAVVNLEDPDLHRLALASPKTVEEAFAKVSSLGILLENRRLGRVLRRLGTIVVSAGAHELAWRALCAYLGGPLGLGRTSWTANRSAASPSGPAS